MTETNEPIVDQYTLWQSGAEAVNTVVLLIKSAESYRAQVKALTERVEWLRERNYELEQQLRVARPDSSFRLVEFPPPEEVPDNVQILIEGNYEKGFWYIRHGLASVISRNKVRLDSRIVLGWRPEDKGDSND